MKAFASSLLAAVALVLLAVGVWDSHGGAARAQGEPRPSDVKIVNGRMEPIPTQATGVTAVTGEVTVRNGTRNPVPVRGLVALAPGRNTVQILSSPAEPVTTCVTCSPFQVMGALSASQGEFADSHGFVTVPPGKRLVIEHVSARAADVLPGRHRLSVFTTANGTGAEHWLRFERTPENDYHCSQPVRIYADEGTTVVVQVVRQHAQGHVFVQCTISGHLVDM